MGRSFVGWKCPQESFEFVTDCLHIKGIESFATVIVPRIRHLSEGGAFDSHSQTIYCSKGTVESSTRLLCELVGKVLQYFPLLIP